MRQENVPIVAPGQIRNGEAQRRRQSEPVPEIQYEDPLEAAVRALLRSIGENPDREGLKRTPQRVARSYRFLVSGYQEDPAATINEAIFSENYREMIVCRNVEFYSLCEHHLLPFAGKAHVAYIPKTRVVGLS